MLNKSNLVNTNELPHPIEVWRGAELQRMIHVTLNGRSLETTVIIDANVSRCGEDLRTQIESAPIGSFLQVYRFDRASDFDTDITYVKVTPSQWEETSCAILPASLSHR